MEKSDWFTPGELMLRALRSHGGLTRKQIEIELICEYPWFRSEAEAKREVGKLIRHGLKDGLLSRHPEHRSAYVLSERLGLTNKEKW